MSVQDQAAIHALEKCVTPLDLGASDHASLLRAAKDKKLVLLGEATHGTQQFYRVRADITARLIEEYDFDAVAVEADWPDAYAINRYVTGAGPEVCPRAALDAFERFPTWMWANTEVSRFITWLHTFNSKKSGRPTGFYGLDLYSMSTSAKAVLDYLERVDPQAANRARKRYSCLDQFIHKPQQYGYAAEMGLTKACEHDITAQLVDLRHKAFRYLTQKGIVDGDEYFCAEQNAKLVRNAEIYYRALFRGRPNSWNLRDQHMAETLGDLVHHLSEQLGREAKVIVWAHNSHIGNAAATEMHRRGEFNIGQLVRESHGNNALLIGFSTSTGEVTAASDWDRPAERKNVRAPLPDSYEYLFHRVSHPNFLLDMRSNNEAIDYLLEPRLMRAIGVIYRPETERQSHYFSSCLPEQFDLLLHFDETDAVRPLHVPMRWHQGELDETYPTGL
ncbi:erythromycin esterase family protein [Kordiimonas lipolytica]|uniref:Erythromycin esterase family protein n=1 Tax=Kordiimonas lipolytica TaxID=1662421 RepID=A0ABV8U7H8_9PROT|nr:erythromycin esterase family protein [Kordiimonas lipolytica]